MVSDRRKVHREIHCRLPDSENWYLFSEESHAPFRDNELELTRKQEPDLVFRMVEVSTRTIEEIKVLET